MRHAKCVRGCDAYVEDMANAQRYNLVRVMIVAPYKRWARGLKPEKLS